MNYCARMPRRRSPGASNMIEMRRAQRSFGDGLIAEEVGDLREDWMQHADQVLADEQMVAAVYEALGKRHPKSRSRGRLGTPATLLAGNRRGREALGRRYTATDAGGPARQA